MAAPTNSIVDQKVRAPSEHGAALILPPASDQYASWKGNLDRLANHEFMIQGESIKSVRSKARKHLIEEAKRYTSRYRETPTFASDNIILSGHQPKLFHPGVWFKNFALSDLGKRLSATSINMIIDNDLCGLSSVSVPKNISATEATTESIAYDIPGGNFPFESREILDRDLFASFADRLGGSISAIIPQPLVHQLWNNVESFVDPDNRLGYTIAAARHRLEGQHGLQTLEIPLSVICQSQEFSGFTGEILSRIDDFQTIHNTALSEYRAVHRIRSATHPVPALQKVDDWYETPFWIWSKDSPIRRALYVSQSGNQIVLSNREDIQLRVDRTDLTEQLFQLTNQQVAIRPRALMTTMYSRMILSDHFIHGIGGSKYDQLTDAIIRRFWLCDPPEFMTITATMKLPYEFEKVSEQDLIRDKQLLRELRFHPEKHIVSPDANANELISTKSSWVAQELPRGQNKQRHDAIARSNEDLQPYVADRVEEIHSHQEQVRSLLSRSRILDSRAYSFCCFDESLISELQQLASK